MPNNRKTKNHVYSEADLYKRFGNNCFVYYRMNTLADLMHFSDVSGARKFCKRHGIRIYRYSRKAADDESTRETIVIKTDLEAVLGQCDIGLKYFRKSSELKEEFRATLVNFYGPYLKELMNVPEHHKFQRIVELTECCEEFRVCTENMLNRLLGQLVRNYPQKIFPRDIDALMELYDSSDDNSQTKISIRNNPEIGDLIELIQAYRKIDFDGIRDFCLAVDAKFAFPKKK